MRVAQLPIGLLAPALVAAVLGAACGRSGSAVAPARHGDPAAIVSEVRVAPAEIRVGESMQIDVVMRNPTALPIQVHFTSGCMVMFAVRDASDEAVAPTLVCTANTPTLVMKPGETLTRRFVWDGTEGGPTTPALPPGEYRVVGGFDPGVLRNASAPVAIRILAP